jgi:D-glycero-D-manno-heptose 1,7-bisphosphate phosphatase
MKKSLIILDRDGVINYDSDDYIKSPDEWAAIPGSLEAIAQLNRAGFYVLIVTNQSGIARGYYDLETLDHIHEKLTNELAAVGGHIEEIYFCPHHPSDHCQCRKPAPGMLHKIRDQYETDFKDVFFVGDSITDVQVALNVGCKPILVLTGKGERTIAKNPELSNHVPTFADLAAAVHFILQKGTL